MAWLCWVRAADPRSHRYRRHGRHEEGEGGKRWLGRAVLTVRVFPPQAGRAAAAAAAGFPPGAAAAGGAPGSRPGGTARAAVPAPPPLPAVTHHCSRPPLAAPPGEAIPVHRRGKWLLQAGCCVRLRGAGR